MHIALGLVLLLQLQCTSAFVLNAAPRDLSSQLSAETTDRATASSGSQQQQQEKQQQQRRRQQQGSRRASAGRNTRDLADDGRTFLREALQALQETGVRAGTRRSAEAAFAGLGAAVEVARDLVAGVRDGTPPVEALTSLSPRALRKLFERLGATYIKIGQVAHAYCWNHSFVNMMRVGVRPSRTEHEERLSEQVVAAGVLCCICSSSHPVLRCFQRPTCWSSRSA